MSAALNNQKHIEKRNLLSSFFITILIGLAYQEMIPPVREEIRTSPFFLPTLVLFLIFFLTSIRFFIGNQLHLISEYLAYLPGHIWLFDLVFIIAQSILFIFMAGVTSLEQNRLAHFAFFSILLAIYALDVVWIFLQWVLGKLWVMWRRRSIPFPWAILNLVLIIFIVICKLIFKDLYSPIGLIALLVVNFFGFVYDVLLTDYYNVLDIHVFLRPKKATADPNQKNVYFSAAYEEACKGFTEGGIPIGAVLVLDDQIIGKGHNRILQQGGTIFHAEMACIEDAGRLKVKDYKRCVLYTTLSPCEMCCGAILLHKIPKIVIGENQSFRGAEDFLRSCGVKIDVLNDPDCISLMKKFKKKQPNHWHEELGHLNLP